METGAAAPQAGRVDAATRDKVANILGGISAAEDAGALGPTGVK